MKQILLMVCALLLLGEVHAQERTVSGTVLDSDGETLPGVNVVIKGSTNGTITDLNGQYKLSVPTDEPVLVFFLYWYGDPGGERGRSLCSGCHYGGQCVSAGRGSGHRLRRGG